jgi:hypothetical protein
LAGFGFDSLLHFYKSNIGNLIFFHLFVGCLTKISSAFYLDKVHIYVNITIVMRKLLFYETESGHKPIEDFLDRLPAKTAQKVTWVMKLVENLERVPSKLPKKGIKIISGGKRNE